MKTTNQVIDSVKRGEEVTTEELKFALINLSVWQNSVLRRLLKDKGNDIILDNLAKSAISGNNVDLEKRIRNTSFEPGISEEESKKRFVNYITERVLR